MLETRWLARRSLPLTRWSRSTETAPLRPTPSGVVRTSSCDTQSNGPSSLRKQGPIPRDLSIGPYGRRSSPTTGAWGNGSPRARGRRIKLIPARRRLDETAIVGRADQDLVHAEPRRHAGDEGDGAADIFRLQHLCLLLLRRRHRARFQDRRGDLAG